MNRRRSLTPPVGIPVPGLPPVRRAGGARRNVSYRVTFFRDPAGEGRSPVTMGPQADPNPGPREGPTEIPGWALNISRGGLRAIVEDRVELGEVLEIDIAEESLKCRGRIVWTQEEPDGMIVGISFLERLTAPPEGVELDASVEIAPGELARTLEMAEAELKEVMADPGPDTLGSPGAGGSSDGRR